MTDKKIQYQLEMLSTKDWKGIQTFLNSDLVKSRVEVKNLFLYLREAYQNKHSFKWDKAVLYKIIFPTKSFNNKQLNNAFSSLSLLIDQYFIFQLLVKDKKLMSVLKTKVYGEKNHKVLFEKVLNQSLFLFEEKADRVPIIDTKKKARKGIDYYLQLHQLHHFAYFFPDKDRYKSGKTNLYQAEEKLDQYYLLSKMRYACEQLSRAKLLKEVPVIDVESLLLKARSYQGQEPLCAIYILLLTLLKKGPQLDLYNSIKELLIQHMSYWDVDDKRYILYQVINSLIDANRNNITYAESKCFEWYKIGANDGLLVFNNRMTEGTFLNVVTIAAGLKEYEFAEQFIHDNKSYLSADIRFHAVKLSRANILYQQKKYDKVISLLKRLPHAKFFYGISARAILTRAYYEAFKSNDEWEDDLAKHLDAHRKYIKTKGQISTQPSHQNFVNAVAKLFKFVKSTKLSKSQIVAFKKEIKLQQKIKLKAWILEKVEELLKLPHFKS